MPMRPSNKSVRQQIKEAENGESEDSDDSRENNGGHNDRGEDMLRIIFFTQLETLRYVE